jgi:hypothetical protein
MRLLLLQLFTGLTVGSRVVFDDKVMEVLDFKISTPLTKGMLRVSWRRPIHFTLICKNKHGGVEVVGSKAVKSVFEAGMSYSMLGGSL